MSGNENENVSQGQGNGAAGWGWEPVPQGGEYDSDATAFVKLPQDMLDALGTGEPLAAPGHGYVPPPMIVPLGSASTDPAATGTWTLPVQWPEAGASGPADPAAGGGGVSAPAPAPVGGPIPASIPIPASVAAAFAEAEPEPDPAATAEWRFPDVPQEPEGGATGQWVMPDMTDISNMQELSEQPREFRQSAPAADWSQAPATLPGGAPAPWANHPDFEGARGYAAQQPAGGPDAGVLPGTDEAVATAAATATATGAGRLLGGPGVGALGRGPRVLGGPGVGTPLPEGEPVHPAPHDIEAAHGPAEMPVEGSRPASSGSSGSPSSFTETDGHGFAAFGHMPDLAAAGGSRFGAGAEFAAGQEFGAGPEPDPEPVVAHEAEAEPVVAPEAVVTASPSLSSSSSSSPAPEPGDTDGHGFAGAAPAPAGIPAGPAPTGDTADTAVAPPTEDTAEGFPAEVPTYEEGTAAAGAVAHHEHPQASYVLRVNGADRPVTGAWIGESLLYVLRERLGLAGAKDGCSQGECGACAVQVDGRLVASCLVPAATAAGSEVKTVEGLATDGELSDVQQALCRSGAVQCGFCVPGMAMTIHDLLEGNHAPSELETRQALCGNLCRCSGYAGVIDAVREVVAGREAATAEPAASPEPRIPHQAAPGEGGIHHGGTV
ncbi:2Fe-2S iron-sulfur cluster-binding protein [Streptomyces sp. NPDC059989]|uniref:2Fe-2S iron-sulfur cluster-binding protein n=1 Tax=Streptomyces sp. NPDC059989 TaxID=3347026 RepID=UPI0036834FB9